MFLPTCITQPTGTSYQRIPITYTLNTPPRKILRMLSSFLNLSRPQTKALTNQIPTIYQYALCSQLPLGTQLKPIGFTYYISNPSNENLPRIFVVQTHSPPIAPSGNKHVEAAILITASKVTRRFRFVKVALGKLRYEDTGVIDRHHLVADLHIRGTVYIAASHLVYTNRRRNFHQGSLQPKIKTLIATIFCPEGSLYDAVVDGSIYNEPHHQKMDFALQILATLVQLMKNKLLFMDLKPENILRVNHRIVFCDFDGLFPIGSSSAIEEVTTRRFASPEWLILWRQTRERDPSTNVIAATEEFLSRCVSWSAGATLWVLMTRHYLTIEKVIDWAWENSLSEDKEKAALTKLETDLNDSFEKFQSNFNVIHPQLLTLLKGLLKICPSERMSIQTAYQLLAPCPNK